MVGYEIRRTDPKYDLKKQLFLLELKGFWESSNHSVSLKRILRFGDVSSSKDILSIINTLETPRRKENNHLIPQIIYHFFEKQKEHSYVDSLTGLYNYDYLDKIRDDISKKDFTLFFFDLDNLKKVNDLQGHNTGNYMLQQFSNALRETFRQNDILIRYGGDEFIGIVFRNKLTVRDFVKRIRKKLDSTTFGQTVFFSVGASENNNCLNDAIAQADKDMYKMKGKHKCSR